MKNQRKGKKKAILSHGRHKKKGRLVCFKYGKKGTNPAFPAELSGRAPKGVPLPGREALFYVRRP